MLQSAQTSPLRPFQLLRLLTDQALPIVKTGWRGSTAATHGAGAPGKQSAECGRPADVMRALHLYLAGKPDQAVKWTPPLCFSGAACLHRSADVLALYEGIAMSSGEPGNRSIFLSICSEPASAFSCSRVCGWESCAMGWWRQRAAYPFRALCGLLVTAEGCAKELCAGMDASSGKAAPNAERLAKLVLVTCERLVSMMVEKVHSLFQT